MLMYLSKIEMSLSDPSVRAALRDAQKMHRLVAGLYQLPRQEAELSYRVQAQGQKVTLYLYAIHKFCLLTGKPVKSGNKTVHFLRVTQRCANRGLGKAHLNFRQIH
jgi:hypothetical protein